jgi:hypothetical protein
MAWNHVVRPIAEVGWTVWDDEARHRVPRTLDQMIDSGRLFCSRPKCPERPAYTYTYNYVTGRRGRVSSQRRHLCAKHAELVCRDYGLEVA